MASVNKVIIVGNLGADPEIRQFDNGGKIATVSVATSDRWTDKQSGEPREKTEWHRIVFSNRLADIVEQYLRKGSQIYVEGSLTTRKWQDPKSGQDRYSTEIRAQSMQMLGSKGGNGGGYQGGQGNYQGSNQSSYQGNYNNQNNYNNQVGYDQGYNDHAPYDNQQYGGQGGYDNDNYGQAQKRPAPKPPVNPLSPNPQDTQPSEISDDDMPF